MKVVEIDHTDQGAEGALVLCWGRGEIVQVRVVDMSAKEYDALPDYEGEC